MIVIQQDVTHLDTKGHGLITQDNLSKVANVIVVILGYMDIISVVMHVTVGTEIVVVDHVQVLHTIDQWDVVDSCYQFTVIPMEINVSVGMVILR